MAPGIGASGILGIAIETTSGTYLAPTKFIPFESESLQYTQDTVWRRPIRQSADLIGAVPGNVHVEGEIGFEALSDCVAMLLHAARHTVVKTGASAPYTYVFTPTSAALPLKTISITIVRNGVVFTYTGCVVGNFTFTVDDGILKFNCSFQGRDEAVASAPTPTWPTTSPFGAGMYSIEIPTATQVFDTDTFEFSVEHNAEAQFRLKSGGSRGAQFIKYGENETTLSVERDFDTRTEYDAFKALTSQSITIACVKTVAVESITINLPTAIKDGYEVAMPGQGDLVRATIPYNGVIDATGKSYTITVITSENIT
jgi:hypothetical protein